MNEFGFMCLAANATNASVYRSLGVKLVEGAHIHEVNHILLRTYEPMSADVVESKLHSAGFHFMPVDYKKHPRRLVLTCENATPDERKKFLQQLKLQRMLFNRRRPSTYWYVALDTLGHAFPPPVAPYTVDRMPPSRWAEYWRKFPHGDVDPHEEDELSGVKTTWRQLT